MEKDPKFASMTAAKTPSHNLLQRGLYMTEFGDKLGFTREVWAETFEIARAIGYDPCMAWWNIPEEQMKNILAIAMLVRDRRLGRQQA